MRLSDFKGVGSLTLNEGESLQYAHGSAVIDTLNGFAYFGTTGTVPGVIVKIRLLPKSDLAGQEIPGFPWESIVIGVVSGLLITALGKKRRGFTRMARFRSRDHSCGA